MTSARITSKGQVTIPKEVRSRLGVDTGDRIEFVEIETGVFNIVPATAEITDLKGIIQKPQKAVSIDGMKAAIKKRAGRKR
ncbi:MAG: AbrB/MazE/SpoVT family DNA-binding domain-containing protein [Gammaproteobacteria bacterium]|nr:AbrB/MazE/SpoVT family DNA-binding domain-containing protein [Gammaproteobacteria bacterium]